MYIGTSLFLIAVGAVLKYAVTVDVSGFDIQTAGLVLMIVGGLALILSLFLAASADRRATLPPPELR